MQVKNSVKTGGVELQRNEAPGGETGEAPNRKATGLKVKSNIKAGKDMFRMPEGPANK